MIPPKLSDKDLAKLARAEALITRSLDKHYTIIQIARMVQMPEKKLKWGFKQTYGMGLFTYLKMHRLQRAKVLMQEKKPLDEIVQEIGYAHPANFSKAFRKMFKEPPSVWRRGQLGRTG